VIIIMVLWLVVLPFGVLGTFGLVQYHQIRQDRRAEAQKARVPELTGLQLEQAQAVAQKAGFPFEVGGRDIAADQKPGTVINQEPWPGELWPSNTTISVMVAAEDPDAEFWREQRRKLDRYQKQGLLKPQK
jgi:beta-lactam-binding protein with PASTA domain